jgi:pimeloyl-ACP methyl ester carboxylesterase
MCCNFKEASNKMQKDRGNKQTKQEETMVPRAQAAKDVEVNGVRLQYIEQGSGEPIVFVHGAPHDLRAWEPVREEIAKKYRFIAYTQRYFGIEPWPDEGKNFSISTHADDLAKFITALNAGPVHLVGWSHGGAVAATAAVGVSLVRSLILYEATIISVLPAESPEGKIAREDRAKMAGPYIAVAKAGDFTKAAKLLQEAVFRLRPGEFDSLPQDLQTVLLDNARTVPLMLAAPPPPIITCDMLKDFTRPTLVMRGEKTLEWWALVSEAITKCVPGAQQVILPNVNHDGPCRDPAAFTAAVFEFLSRL